MRRAVSPPQTTTGKKRPTACAASSCLTRLGSPLERLGLAAAESAYVGDSPEDVLMARSAGVLAIGVPGGFPNREALAAAAPDLLCPNLESAISTLLR